MAVVSSKALAGGVVSSKALAGGVVLIANRMIVVAGF